MTVDVRVDALTVRIEVTAKIDVPGRDYSDRKMAWLRGSMEKELLRLVGELQHLSWEQT